MSDHGDKGKCLARGSPSIVFVCRLVTPELYKSPASQAYLGQPLSPSHHHPSSHISEHIQLEPFPLTHMSISSSLKRFLRRGSTTSDQSPSERRHSTRVSFRQPFLPDTMIDETPTGSCATSSVRDVGLYYPSKHEMSSIKPRSRTMDRARPLRRFSLVSSARPQRISRT